MRHTPPNPLPKGMTPISAVRRYLSDSPVHNHSHSRLPILPSVVIPLSLRVALLVLHLVRLFVSNPCRIRITLLEEVGILSR